LEETVNVARRGEAEIGGFGGQEGVGDGWGKKKGVKTV